MKAEWLAVQVQIKFLYIPDSVLLWSGAPSNCFHASFQIWTPIRYLWLVWRKMLH